MSRRIAPIDLLLVVLAASACVQPPSSVDESEPDSHAAVVAPHVVDDDNFPPPSTPVEPSPLIDQSRDLYAILEYGTLSRTDCDAYFAGNRDRTTTLRCGKWMFFYENIGVPGSPAGVVDLIRNHAPNTVGRSLERLGLFPDPYSATGLPVGMADGPPMTAGVPTYTLTCGACHFGKTTDGRYVVGSPNHQFAFGKFVLSVASLPELAPNPFATLPPEAELAIGAVRNEVFGAGTTRLDLIVEAIKLLPSVIAGHATTVDNPAKIALAVLRPGVMDPYASPGLDDHAAIPVKMSPLWGIDPLAMTAAGSTHGAMLGSNGGAPDLAHILRTFAFIAGQIRGVPLGPSYDPANVEPLIQYIMSLTPPRPETLPDAALVASGKELFRESCFGCHAGPGFAGVEVFDPLVIGTDPNVVHLVNPDDSGRAMYDVLTPPEVTRGLRTRRLSAIWSQSRFFHNGSLSSLEEVFCLTGPRVPSALGAGFSTAGHSYTCDGLSVDDKNSLIAFLRSL